MKVIGMRTDHLDIQTSINAACFLFLLNKTGYMLSQTASWVILRDCAYRTFLPLPWKSLEIRQLADQLQALRRNSSSSTRWKSRQGKDSFAREAKVQGLKSRAAFKLLEVRYIMIKETGFR